MGGVVDMDAARRLVGDASLWPRVRDFLWDFAPQIHASHLPEGFATFAKQTPRLRKFVLDAVGVKPMFHDFPADDWSRLALLDGATLESLVKWVGAVVCASSLRRVMDGAKVRVLKASLPGIYPDVFSYTAYFGDLKDSQDISFDGLDGDGIVASVVGIGRDILFSFLPDSPGELRQRILLKLPKDLSDNPLPEPQNDKTTEPPNHQTIKPSNLKKLLRLKFPEAHALCCS